MASIPSEVLRFVTTSDPVLKPTIEAQLERGLFNQHVSNESLFSLGEHLGATSKQRLATNGTVYHITDAIQLDIPVARFYVSGPYGRMVAVGTPQIDLVVFIRNQDELPPYHKPSGVLQRIYTSVVKHLSHKPKVVVPPMSFPAVTQGGKQSHHSPAPPTFVSLQIDNVRFRIYPVPALGRTAEEQRQATYRLMHSVYLSGGLQALEAWHPSLCERSSRAMASERAEIHAFIRTCVYWTKLRRIESMEVYAIEVLGLLVAQKLKKASQRDAAKRTQSPLTAPERIGDENQSLGASRVMEELWRFDFLEAFRSFLWYLSHPKAMVKLCEIESPASYETPWTDNVTPVLTDNFNPYRNLISTMSPEDLARLGSAASETLKRLDSSCRESPLTLAALFASLPSDGGHLLDGRSSTWRLVIRLFILLIGVLCIIIVGLGWGNQWPQYGGTQKLTQLLEPFWAGAKHTSEGFVEQVKELSANPAKIAQHYAPPARV